ncbi:MAG: hypothetical protein H6Q37_823 [Chloroflexi bacterium]|jgi:anti-sigma regulatory factor (Ser/Thr protein kinase)|nr:hypothetical protein [Chloroflexota bacterium]
MSANDPIRDLDSLQINAELVDLETIRHYIEQRAALFQLNPSITYDIQLAVTEIVTNSLVHGYPERRGWIEVQIDRLGQKIYVWIRDRAPEFDPTQHLAPDLSKPLNKRHLGGLGIHLTRQITQKISHRNLPEGGNETTLVFGT